MKETASKAAEKKQPIKQLELIKVKKYILVQKVVNITSIKVGNKTYIDRDAEE